MSEYIFDAILIIFGATLTAVGWWLLVHNSDRRLLRNFRPRFENPGLSKDEVVASRSLNLAFFAIIVKLIGTVLLIVGILRLFGFGALNPTSTCSGLGGSLYSELPGQPLKAQRNLRDDPIAIASGSDTTASRPALRQTVGNRVRSPTVREGLVAKVALADARA